MQELKPCPFCGESRIGVECSAGGLAGRDLTYNVRCHKCMAACAGYGTREIAVKWWNTRYEAAKEAQSRDDLTERVARALCVRNGVDPEEVNQERGYFGWHDYVSDAQAAIAVMPERESTQPAQETIDAIEEYLCTLVREGNIDCISCSIEGMMEQITPIIRKMETKRESTQPDERPLELYEFSYPKYGQHIVALRTKDAGLELFDAVNLFSEDSSRAEAERVKDEAAAFAKKFVAQFNRARVQERELVKHSGSEENPIPDDIRSIVLEASKSVPKGTEHIESARVDAITKAISPYIRINDHKDST